MHFIITAIIIFFAWVAYRPDQALALVAELKRRLRLHIIQRTGRQGTQEVAQGLHDWAARQGFDPELVNRVIEEQQEEIFFRLGTKHANDRLGEPTIFERTY